MQSERVKWIDVLKGIGILFVIMGHVLTRPLRNESTLLMTIYDVIYCFHMPLMLYASGRTFSYSLKSNKYNLPEYTLTKFKQLIIPYIFYGGAVYIVFIAANSIHKLASILENSGYGRISFVAWLKGMVIGDNLYTYHLWFLYALFLLSVLTRICVRKIGYKVLYVLLGIGIILHMVRLYWDTSSLGVYNIIMKNAVWFFLGVLFDLSNLKGKKFGVLGIIAAVYMVAKEAFGNFLGIKSALLYETLHVVAVFFIIYLFICISRYVSGRVEQFFDYIGRNSMAIYLFHQPFFASGVGLVLYKVMNLPVGITIILAIILCYICPLVIQAIIKNTVLGVLFLGKKAER